MRGCSGWRLFHLLGMLGVLGPGAGPSSSHHLQQEPWGVKWTQLPPDLPALPQEHSLHLITMCTNFLLVSFFHNSHGKYPARK